MHASKCSLYFLILALFLFSNEIKAQIPFLEKKISVQVRNLPVDELLKIISQKGEFTFSYSTQLIPESKTVSVQVQNKSVREILDLVFEGKVAYKERGKHIILQKAELSALGKEPEYIIVSGYVKDATNGTEVSQVSIFDKLSRVSALSDQYGFFTLKIKIKDKFRDVTLFVNKENYQDTIVYINQSGHSVLNITMYPDEKIVTYVDSSAIRDSIFTVNRLALVNMILSEQEQANTRNIKDTLYRKFQVSFLPYLGSNLKLSGNTVNDYSLNILAGYSMGTKKLEIGGLLNLDRDSVKVAQIAGLINITGGPVQGAQVAGLINYNLRPVKCVQVAGLVNTNMDSARAVSIAGLLNVNLSPAKGFQVAGLMNFNLKTSKVAQVAGLINVTAKGIQGVQIAGLMNVCLDTIKGGQVAGLLNISKTVIGSQVGFLNISDTCSGIPVGFLSFVRKGLHQLEISSNEVYPLNVSFRTGVRQFYNIFEAGMQFKTPEDHTWYLGYGVGTALSLSNNWQLDFDFTMNQPIRGNRFNEFNSLTKINIAAEKKIGKGFSIAAGPTLNILYANTSDPDYEDYLNRISPGSFSSSSISGDYKRSIWLGAKIGLRFF